ncbi:hypothetical protein GCM10023201_21050 [Actinomycetospora corticicola]|uniref:Uracil DNA glycosylase superfamily protein n=1 Tax=Actinomycetospora corticicola TaxID=663602 RepID=A0A7Y9J403_9PSEU|nr:uracil-DNA glycosylase [Actinomycetospora corticicola]NYD34179.1 hypothetical protein [Actinomycetospora corticicola]
MAQASFRAEQEAQRYAEHVRPINEMVDELSGTDRGWMPHVAPAHGGVHAPILSVLRDPGPKTMTGTGSGFLCVENDDPTAQTQMELMAMAGVATADITPWNAYPWYINAAPTPAQLDAGVDPLRRLVLLMPSLVVVVLQGGEAQSSWRRLTKRHPDVARRPRLVVTSYHPSRTALRTPDPEVRAARVRRREEAWREVGAAVADARSVQ